jgi:hypothetical protein
MRPWMLYPHEAAERVLKIAQGPVSFGVYWQGRVYRFTVDPNFDYEERPYPDWPESFIDRMEASHG